MKRSVGTKEYETFIDLLWRAREEKGMTQVELAKKLKTGQGFISKCENLERRLDLIETRHWLDALGVPFVDFMKKLDRKLGRKAK